MRDQAITYTILVNSTDSFEDCWIPFFKLFVKYWSLYSGTIYLNTETKDFSYQNLPIICTKVRMGAKRKRLTWSECLLRAFDQIQTDIILYLQEDYFLNDYVHFDQIEYFVDLMMKDDITYISLVDYANGGPFHLTRYRELWGIDQKADYRISTQASLWNIKKMRRYIKVHETPWYFEIYGTKRAHRIRDSFYCVNRVLYNSNNPIISYEPTGIVKGKWKKEAVFNLFLANGIEVDFSQRGFYVPASASPPKAPLSTRIISRLRSTF
jgi:hypothetical protein